jgi:hypothetical protein
VTTILSFLYVFAGAAHFLLQYCADSGNLPDITAVIFAFLTNETLPHTIHLIGNLSLDLAKLYSSSVNWKLLRGFHIIIPPPASIIA